MNLFDHMGDDVCSGRHHGNERSVAANAVAVPGKLTMRVKIVAFIALQGRAGATLHECAAHLGVEVNRISGRCSALKAAGLIFDSGSNRPTPNGALATVYVSRKEWCA